MKRFGVDLTVLLVAAAAVFVYAIAQPMQWLAGICADDMFYYLAIARNMAATGHATFDGSTPTNGFHPLYAGWLWLCFTLAPGRAPETYVRLGLVLPALATLVGGVSIYLLVKEAYRDRLAAFVSALCWLAHPSVVAVSLAGLEAPIATSLLVAALALVLRWRQRAPERRHDAIVGSLLGLACLARTDSIFLAVALGLYYARPWSREGVRVALVTASTALVWLGPWLGWNLLRFGRITQDSARALSARQHELLVAADGEVAGRVLRNLANWYRQLGELSGLGVWGLLVVGVAALALWARRRDAICGFALWTIVSVGTFYPLYLWFRQRWYFFASLMALALLAGALVAALRSWPQWRMARVARGLAVALVVATLAHAGYRVRGGIYPWQRFTYRIALDLHQRLKPGLKVGAFNAGVLGYFGPGVTVNLDGVVNGDALKAMQDRRLLAYLDEQEVTVLIDLAGALRDHARFTAHGRIEGFRLLQTIALPGTRENIVILRRDE